MAVRRYGEPLTEAERRERHLALTGEETLPPRGTRIASLQVESTQLFWALLLGHVALIGLELYLARKQGWI